MNYYSALKFGYNGDLNSDRNRESNSDKWFCDYPDILLRKPLPFVEECIYTAKLIRENTSLPLYILLSGGHDSIGVAESFRLAKIPFKTAIAVFETKSYKNLNYYDVSHAIEYCKQFSIPYDIYNLNVEKFWENDLLYYAEPIQCRSPQLLVQNWIIDQIDGYPILGSGEPWVYKGERWSKDVGHMIFMSSEGEQYQHNEKWLIHKKREGCGKFYKYTKELKVAGILDPLIINWMKRHINIHKAISLDRFKNEIYPKWFNVGARIPIHYKSFTGKRRTVTRSDYTGFEFISDLDRVYRNILTNMFPGEFDEYQDEVYIENMKHMCDGKDFMEEKVDWAIKEIMEGV